MAAHGLSILKRVDMMLKLVVMMTLEGRLSLRRVCKERRYLV